MLAQLQRPFIGHDRPAVARLDLCSIVGHGAKTIRDHVKQVAVGGLSQPVDVQRGRLPISAAYNHSLSVAGAVVTRRAIDIEALTPTLDYLFGDREWEFVGRLAVGTLALVEQSVGVQMPARHGSLHGRTYRAAVAEEIRRAQRNIPRLVVHILAARDREKQEDGHGNTETQRPGGRVLRASVTLCHNFTEQLPRPPSAPDFPETRSCGGDRKADRWLRCTGRNGCGTRKQNAER